MKILYIFPHPDDESFGPVAAMYKQLNNGHNVFLLTLTRGGATKQRFKLGLSVEEMGEIRLKEMMAVNDVLGLTGMDVLDMPDGGLKEMDPREIESVVKKYIQKIKPEILVSYPVHGISGFHDHLVMHAVAKRVFLEMKDDRHSYLKRLAFFTLPDKGGSPFQNDGFRLKHSEEELIDCIITLGAEEIEMLKRCLSCYVTYKDVIEESGVIDKIGDKLFFEIYGEDFKPPLDDLTIRLK